MASRFVVADNDVIEELKTSSENLNTRKSTNVWVGIFKKWAAWKKIDEDNTRFKNLTAHHHWYYFSRLVDFFLESIWSIYNLNLNTIPNLLSSHFRVPSWLRPIKLPIGLRLIKQVSQSMKQKHGQA